MALLSEAAAPGLLAFAALLLNLFFYSGFYLSDDVSYLGAVLQLAAFEPIDAANLAHTRLTVNVPAALVYGLSGSVKATILSFCLYHPLVVGLAYLAGRLAFDRRCALYGAALVAFSPVLYYFGGAILPDNTLCLWLGVLTCTLLWVVREAHGGRLSARREAILWSVTGLLTGLAYSAKEPGLVASVPVAGTLLVSALRRRGIASTLGYLAAFGAGLGVLMLIETCVLRLATGHWVIRLLAGVGSSGTSEHLLERVQDQGLWPRERFVYWYAHARVYFGAGVALWLALLGNVAAWFVFDARERRGLAILQALWLWLFLYLTFGTSSFSRYVPPPIQHARYYSICAVPAFLVSGAALYRAAERIAARLAQHASRARPRLVASVRSLPAVAVAGLALVMFVAVAPDAGTAYHTLETRAALAAIGAARAEYPGHLILLSRRLSDLRPLLPMLPCEGCSNLVFDARLGSAEDLPARACLLLSSHPSEHDAVTDAVDELLERRAVRVEPAGAGDYLAPRDARDALRDALFAALRPLGVPAWGAANRKRKEDAVQLRLVTRTGG